MFSGKSTELIRKIRLAKIINKKVLVIKPIIDIRYKNNKIVSQKNETIVSQKNETIVSHSFEQEECQAVENLKDIDYLINNYDVIVIDEGQFFPDLKDYVIKWVELYNKEIIVGGLDGDSKRNKIGQMLDLIPYSDTCIKINSLCKKCNDGTPGLFSFRTNDNQEQVQIGGAETYMPVCRMHYIS